MAHDFDRIMRENFEGIVAKSHNLAVLPFEFNYNVVASFYTPNMSKTIERKIDFAKIVEDPNQKQKRQVLHIEFQTKAEPEMVLRMQLYKSLIQDMVQLPVKQYVIYLGSTPAKMATRILDYIPGDFTNYYYNLIEIRKYDANQLLASDIPEVIVLAILASRGNAEPYPFVIKVLKRLKEVCHSQTDVDKFVLQLVTVSKLRNLEEVFIKHKEDMALNTGISFKDYLWFQEAQREGQIEGQRVGKREEKVEIASKMLQKAKYSVEDIADVTGLPVETITAIAKGL